MKDFQFFNVNLNIFICHYLRKPDLFRIFGESKNSCKDDDSEVILALRNKSISPWSWKFFELVRLKSDLVGGGAPVMMHKWISLVAKAFPGCVINFICESLPTQ